MHLIKIKPIHVSQKESTCWELITNALPTLLLPHIDLTNLKII